MRAAVACVFTCRLRTLLERYELQDLSVTEVLPQQVALSECFIQIYERA